MTTAPSGVRIALGFVPPELVFTTTVPEEPVGNAPQFFVMNAAVPGGEALTFRNPDRLTVDSELPPRGAPDRTLDCFYVYFPWGDHPGALCTEDEADGIHLSALSAGWQVLDMSSEEVGRYWTVFPEDEAILAPQESVMLAFDSIVAVSEPNAPDEATLLFLEHPLPGGGKDVFTAPLTKRAPRPTVTLFSGSPMTVAKGSEVTLVWRTMGARACRLQPGDVTLGTSGTTTVHPPHTTTYTLIATDGGDPTPDDDRQIVPITVPPVAIDSFVANPRQSRAPGDHVELAWKTSYASGASIDQGIGPVPASGSLVVTPRRTTTYSLTCDGEDGPADATVQIVVPPGVRLRARVDRATMEAVLDWDTENCVSCRLTVSGATFSFDDDVSLSGRDVRYQRLSPLAVSLTGRGADGTETTIGAFC